MVQLGENIQTKVSIAQTGDVVIIRGEPTRNRRFPVLMPYDSFEKRAPP